MNKTELIAAIAEKAEMSKKDSGNALNAFISITTEQIANGEKVQLVGFGTFEISERKARTGRNPKTNEAIQIPASKVPKFVSGKSLREAVNQ